MPAKSHKPARWMQTAAKGTCPQATGRAQAAMRYGTMHEDVLLAAFNWAVTLFWSVLVNACKYHNCIWCIKRLLLLFKVPMGKKIKIQSWSFSICSIRGSINKPANLCKPNAKAVGEDLTWLQQWGNCLRARRVPIRPVRGEPVLAAQPSPALPSSPPQDHTPRGFAPFTVISAGEHYNVADLWLRKRGLPFTTPSLQTRLIFLK